MSVGCRCRTGCIMSMWRLDIAFGLAMVPALVATGLAASTLPHRIGHTTYALVERPDGTYRTMMIDNGSVVAMRNGRVPETSSIRMESFAGERLTSVFIKRLQGEEWLYGAIRPGEGVEAFRSGSHCASCHRSASDRDGLFTQGLLRAFVETGRIQKASCGRPGRSPCEADVYGGD